MTYILPVNPAVSSFFEDLDGLNARERTTILRYLTSLAWLMQMDETARGETFGELAWRTREPSDVEEHCDDPSLTPSGLEEISWSVLRSSLHSLNGTPGFSRPDQALILSWVWCWGELETWFRAADAANLSRTPKNLQSSGAAYLNAHYFHQLARSGSLDRRDPYYSLTVSGRKKGRELLERFLHGAR